MPSAPDSLPHIARKRCAIYTRKSSEHGLQQDFNTLDAQRAVCSAYIQSQQHRGWCECGEAYEDAAQSGATLERPTIAILDGTQPPQQLTRRKLLDANLPLDWALQRKLFGFAEQAPMKSSERY